MPSGLKKGRGPSIARKEGALDLRVALQENTFSHALAPTDTQASTSHGATTAQPSETPSPEEDTFCENFLGRCQSKSGAKETTAQPSTLPAIHQAFAPGLSGSSSVSAIESAPTSRPATETTHHSTAQETVKLSSSAVPLVETTVGASGTSSQALVASTPGSTFAFQEGFNWFICESPLAFSHLNDAYTLEITSNIQRISKDGIEYCFVKYAVFRGSRLAYTGALTGPCDGPCIPSQYRSPLSTTSLLPTSSRLIEIESTHGQTQSATQVGATFSSRSAELGSTTSSTYPAASSAELGGSSQALVASTPGSTFAFQEGFNWFICEAPFTYRYLNDDPYTLEITSNIQRISEGGLEYCSVNYEVFNGSHLVYTGALTGPCDGPCIPSQYRSPLSTTSLLPTSSRLIEIESTHGQTQFVTQVGATSSSRSAELGTTRSSTTARREDGATSPAIGFTPGQTQSATHENARSSSHPTEARSSAPAASATYSAIGSTPFQSASIGALVTSAAARLIGSSASPDATPFGNDSRGFSPVIDFNNPSHVAVFASVALFSFLAMVGLSYLFVRKCRDGIRAARFNAYAVPPEPSAPQFPQIIEMANLGANLGDNHAVVAHNGALVVIDGGQAVAQAPQNLEYDANAAHDGAGVVGNPPSQSLEYDANAARNEVRIDVRDDQIAGAVVVPEGSNVASGVGPAAAREAGEAVIAQANHASQANQPRVCNDSLGFGA